MKKKEGEKYSKGQKSNSTETHSNNKRQRSLLSSQRNKKPYRRSMRPKINTSGFYFDMQAIIICWIFFVVVFIVLQIAFYLSIRSNAVHLSNYVDTYIVGVELWNAVYVAHTCAFNTIIWNNTNSYWGQNSLKTFRERMIHLENVVNKRMVATLQYDLGNYTDTWQQILTKVSFFSWL